MRGSCEISRLVISLFSWAIALTASLVFKIIRIIEVWKTTQTPNLRTRDSQRPRHDLFSFHQCIGRKTPFVTIVECLCFIFFLTLHFLHPKFYLFFFIIYISSTFTSLCARDFLFYIFPFIVKAGGLVYPFF